MNFEVTTLIVALCLLSGAGIGYMAGLAIAVITYSDWLGDAAKWRRGKSRVALMAGRGRKVVGP